MMNHNNYVSNDKKILLELMGCCVFIYTEEDQVKIELKVPEPPPPVVQIIMPEYIFITIMYFFWSY